MTEAPQPLVPAEVDLRDFAFMPLDVQRLRDSDLASDETPEACWAAVLLWCASWHQVPAASIPDNEQWQAKQCGYVAQGKVSPGWKRIRGGALRGWLPCADGRLYHPVVAEKAIDAWRSKLLQRWKTEAARVKKHNQRHQLNGADAAQMLEFEDWMRVGCPRGHQLPVPEDKAPSSPGTGGQRPEEVPRETPSKGQGQGQGQGQGLEEEKRERATAPPPLRAPDDANPPEANGHEPTAAGRVCRAMRSAGLSAVNPGDPRLLTLLTQGATEAEFEGLAAEAAEKGRGFAWVLAALQARRADAAAIALAKVPDPQTGAKAADETQRYLAAQQLTPEQRKASEEARRRVMGARQGATT